MKLYAGSAGPEGMMGQPSSAAAPGPKVEEVD
jgi:hypothetical protein